jgi:hypothetical protein
MQGMGDPIPDENRSVAGSMVKESRLQSEVPVAV